MGERRGMDGREKATWGFLRVRWYDRQTNTLMTTITWAHAYHWLGTSAFVNFIVSLVPANQVTRRIKNKAGYRTSQTKVRIHIIMYNKSAWRQVHDTGLRPMSACTSNKILRAFLARTLDMSSGPEVSTVSNCFGRSSHGYCTSRHRSRTMESSNESRQSISSLGAAANQTRWNLQVDTEEFAIQRTARKRWPSVKSCIKKACRLSAPCGDIRMQPTWNRIVDYYEASEQARPWIKLWTLLHDLWSLVSSSERKSRMCLTNFDKGVCQSFIIRLTFPRFDL